MNNKFEKCKNYIIVIGAVIFILMLCFSWKAGCDIGSEIGEFIYNITH